MRSTLRMLLTSHRAEIATACFSIGRMFAMLKISLDLTYTESRLHVNNFSYTKSMAAKMGRPRVPKGKQKIPFPIRFARDDVAAFKRAARLAKLPVNDWVTLTLTEAAGKT